MCNRTDAVKGGPGVWPILILDLPIIVEVIRKYLIYADILFVVGDIAALCAFIYLSVQFPTRLRFSSSVKAAALAFVIIAAFVQVLQSRNILLLAVGLRALIVPLMYGLIGAIYVSKAKNSVKRLLLNVNILIAIIASVALIQVQLPATHWLNTLPEAASGVYYQGMGDLGEAAQSYGLFRPTSLFMHTGKFGQVIFTLTLFQWMLIGAAEIKLIPRLIAITLGITGVLLSGQRAAELCLFIIAAAMFIRWPLVIARQRALEVFLGVLVVLGLIFFVSHRDEGVFQVYFNRFQSGWNDVSPRLEDNSITPLRQIVDRYLYFGEGCGYFTLGGDRFGGALLYNQEGAESAWLRILAEVGMPGLVSFLVMYFGLGGRALALYRTPGLALIPRRQSLYLVLWLGSISIWGLTHDVLADSVAMSVALGLGGVAFSDIATASRRPRSLSFAPSSVRVSA